MHPELRHSDQHSTVEAVREIYELIRTVLLRTYGGRGKDGGLRQRGDIVARVTSDAVTDQSEDCKSILCNLGDARARE